MTRPYVIVDAVPRHCGALVRRMRAVHIENVAKAGKNAHAELRSVMGRSRICKSCVMDGRVVAMWGVMGSSLGDVGVVWLVAAESLVAMPFAFAREARRQLKILMQGYEEVATTILEGDEAAMRFAVFLGFHDRHDGAHTRRETVELLRSQPRIRLRMGNTNIIGLGCHSEAVH
jgi:hypothetical protein